MNGSLDRGPYLGRGESAGENGTQNLLPNVRQPQGTRMAAPGACQGYVEGRLLILLAQNRKGGGGNGVAHPPSSQLDSDGPAAAAPLELTADDGIGQPPVVHQGGPAQPVDLGSYGGGVVAPGQKPVGKLTRGQGAPGEHSQRRPVEVVAGQELGSPFALAARELERTVGPEHIGVEAALQGILHLLPGDVRG